MFKQYSWPVLPALHAGRILYCSGLSWTIEIHPRRGKFDLPPLARASPTVAVYEVCVALYKPGRPRQARLQLSCWAGKALESSLVALLGAAVRTCLQCRKICGRTGLLLTFNVVHVNCLCLSRCLIHVECSIHLFLLLWHKEPTMRLRLSTSNVRVVHGSKPGSWQHDLWMPEFNPPHGFTCLPAVPMLVPCRSQPVLLPGEAWRQLLGRELLCHSRPAGCPYVFPAYGCLFRGRDKRFAGPYVSTIRTSLTAHAGDCEDDRDHRYGMDHGQTRLPRDDIAALCNMPRA